MHNYEPRVDIQSIIETRKYRAQATQYSVIRLAIGC